MSHTIELSVNELKIVMAALGTVNTVGGGSFQNTLLIRLAEETDYPLTGDIHQDEVNRLTKLVLQNQFEQILESM